MSFALQILLLVFSSSLSFIFSRRIVVHNVSIKGVSFLGVQGVRYISTLDDDVHFDLTCSSISFHFHFPTRSRPRWLTFSANNILYKSSTCDLHIGSLVVTCWFFPRLFRQTAGPWTNVEVDDFRVRVMRSDKIPRYIQALRANIVEAILTGEFLRVDDFTASTRFDGLSEHAVEQSEDVHERMPDKGSYSDHLDENDGAVHETLADSDGKMKCITNHLKSSRPVPFLSQEQDEMRISVHARGFHINNQQGRHYSFGSIDAQHRRNWSANRGTFVMVVTEGRWTKIPASYEMVAPSSWLLQLLSSVMHFPYDLWRCSIDPTAMANVYMPRVDVTFDNFRMRDAELVVQGLSLVKQKMTEDGIQWNDFLVDCVANLALGMLRSR